MGTLLAGFPNLLAAISTKANGSMGVASQVRRPDVGNRRQRFCQSIGIDPDRLVVAELIHGNAVEVVGSEQSGKVISQTDGLVTKEPNLFLSVTVADCLPIYFFDPVRKTVGLAHAGWRGVVKTISANGIETMRTLGSDPKDIIVFVGPHICGQHYEIKADVATQFSQYPSAITFIGEATFLNLSEVVRQQLIAAGIQSAHIELSAECTFSESQTYYSARRDRPKELETMLAVIGLRPSS